jgi:tripartite-type tricarboxylate transporter receptor subunit TctC
MMADWAPIAAQLKSGALRPLAVTSARRWPSLPDVPTVAEQGFPGYELEIWFGVCAPAKTPAAVVTRINDEMRKWLSTAEAREAFAAVGHEPAPRTRPTRCASASLPSRSCSARRSRPPTSRPSSARSRLAGESLWG